MGLSPNFTVATKMPLCGVIFGDIEIVSKFTFVFLHQLVFSFFAFKELGRFFAIDIGIEQSGLFPFFRVRLFHIMKNGSELRSREVCL